MTIINMKYYFVYIATNKRHTVLYTGVTNNIQRRENQHKEKLNKNSFTSKYNIDKIVHYETFEDIKTAIAREKQIKGWRRDKKIVLIDKYNKKWNDLIEESLKYNSHSEER